MSETPILKGNTSIPVSKDISSSSLLEKIRRRFSERRDVYVVGEVPIPLNLEIIPYEDQEYIGLENIEFYAAPTKPLYEDKDLTDLITSLFPDTKPLHEYDHEFKKLEYEKYGAAYWTMHLGSLRFREQVGLLYFIKYASRYESYDDESLHRWEIDASIKGKVDTKPVMRFIDILVFPEIDWADLIYRYYQFYHNPSRHNPILKLVGIDPVKKEDLDRIFGNLRGRIDAYDYHNLHNGSLRKDLEELLKRHNPSKD